MWQSAVQVEIWWGGVHGRGASVDAKTINNFHSKMMVTVSASTLVENEQNYWKWLRTYPDNYKHQITL